MDDDELEALIEAISPRQLNRDYVVTALLGRQYFPRVKRDGEELPPLLCSESFTEAAAAAIKTDTAVKDAGWVELRTRRYDGLRRRLGIPHPVPYAKLAIHMGDHWLGADGLASKLSSTNAMITARANDDGRIVQMDYGDRSDEHAHKTQLAMGKHFLAKADISNCFPSIYTHALDWAYRGKSAAKKRRARTDGSVGQILDLYSREILNGETKGLLIGPASSNLLAELVLQQIDSRLAAYSFTRYIDDYSAYCSTREEAENFIVDLQRALGDYRLDLNSRKTEIRSLRDGLGDEWMADVFAHLPTADTAIAAVRFIQQAEHLAARHPKSSVLKFALKTLLGDEERTATSSEMVVDEIVRVAQYHPEVLPSLSRLLKPESWTWTASHRDRLARALSAQLADAIRRGETDVVLWLIHLIRADLFVALDVASIPDLIGMDDDLVWIALGVHDTGTHADIAARIKELAYDDESDYDSHWLARYEFWRAGILKADDRAAREKNWMKTLKDNGVAFSALKRERRAAAK